MPPESERVGGVRGGAEPSLPARLLKGVDAFFKMCKQLFAPGKA